MSHHDVRLDFSSSMEECVQENGLKSEEIETLQVQTSKIHQGLNAMKEVGQLPFYHLPYEEENAQKIVRRAQEYQSQFENLVVLGIGGSALGTKALLNSLQGPYHLLNQKAQENPIRVFVCDSIDPDSFVDLLDRIDLKNTLFNVISKSGNTLETMSQLMLVIERLKKEVGSKWTHHLVMTTDPHKGILRSFASEHQIQTFEISPGVGGRFSVLTPVGLFPAAMAGIPILELLEGARRADVRCSNADLWMNPAYFLAVLHYLMFQKGRNISVMMPYSDLFFSSAEWYVQLWAESIGKAFSLKGEKIFTGSTPVAACGPRDQHSQLQLFMEGPEDKFLIFMILENYKRQISVRVDESLKKEYAYLEGRSLQEIILAEARATEEALKAQKRPSCQLLIPHRNAYSMGQLFFLLEVMTAFAGELFNVNPFDQPGVELGKKMANGLLGKPGFEEYREKIRFQKNYPQFVI